jgi:integrase
VARWFGGDGERFSRSFSGRKEAERFAETKQQDVRAGKGDPPPRISLREYLKEHGQLMKGSLAPKTLHMHLAAGDLLAKSVGEDRCLNSISVRDVELFRAERLKTGITPSSANREIRTLKRLFNMAILRGYMPAASNPCMAVSMMKVGRKRPAYCSPADFHLLYRRAPDLLWQSLLVVLYTAGIRLREALNLTWSDIDFDAGTLYVTRKTASGWVQAWTPKDHEMRAIPLPEQAVNVLSAWQAVAPEQCPYVFMEAGRWQYYRQQVVERRWRQGCDLVNNMLRRFKTICRMAGVGPFTIHDLRRSCITNWAQRLPIHVVQQLAGHSDIKTTQQFYLSVQPEDVDKAKAIQASLLGDVVASGPTDQLLTNSGRKREFPRKGLGATKTQAVEDQRLA